jgi:tetratricopeptide (TPR) repeat protein
MWGSRLPFSLPISPESMARETAQFERDLAEAEAEGGPDSQSALAARSELGQAYRFAGRSRDAIAVHEQNLAACVRVLGPDDPQTPPARRDLAWSWLAMGRLTDAVAGMEQSLADHERVLGADHPATVVARSDLGNALLVTGAFTLAQPLLEQALADGERVLGRDHPDTLACRDRLATVHASEGRVGLALKLAKRHAAACKRVLPPGHPDEVGSRSTLGIAYRSTQRITAGITEHRGALSDYEPLLGPDHRPADSRREPQSPRRPKSRPSGQIIQSCTADASSGRCHRGPEVRLMMRGLLGCLVPTDPLAHFRPGLPAQALRSGVDSFAQHGELLDSVMFPAVRDQPLAITAG